MIFLALAATISTTCLAQVCNKRLLTKESSLTVVSNMYVVTFVVALVYALLAGGVTVRLPVVLVAAVNVLSALYFARSVRVRLTHSFLFWPITSLVTVCLSMIFLGEWSVFAPWHWQSTLFVLGVVLMVFTFFLFYRAKGTPDMKVWSSSILVFLMTAGVINFLIQYFAVSDVSSVTFLFSWYVGTFLTVLLYSLIKRSWPKPQGHYGLYVLQGFLTVLSMAAVFWALTLAPASLVFPVHTFFTFVIMLLIGLFFFHERRLLVRTEWIALLIGVVGVVAIVLGVS